MTSAARKSHSPADEHDCTRDRILGVARELFAERGYERTTVKAIASRLDLTDPALYHHFRSKRHIFEALLVEPEPAALAHLALPPDSRGELIGRILDAFRSYNESADLVRMVFRQQFAGEASSIAFLRQSRATYLSLFRPPFEALYGERGGTIVEALFVLISGLAWETMLAHGADFARVVQQDAFLDRVRAMIELVLPPVDDER